LILYYGSFVTSNFQLEFVGDFVCPYILIFCWNPILKCELFLLCTAFLYLLYLLTQVSIFLILDFKHFSNTVPDEGMEARNRSGMPICFFSALCDTSNCKICFSVLVFVTVNFNVSLWICGPYMLIFCEIQFEVLTGCCVYRPFFFLYLLNKVLIFLILIFNLFFKPFPWWGMEARNRRGALFFRACVAEHLLNIWFLYLVFGDRQFNFTLWLCVSLHFDVCWNPNEVG